MYLLSRALWGGGGFCVLVAVLSCAAGPVSLAVLVTPSLGRHGRQWKQMQPWPKPCCSGGGGNSASHS